MMTKPTNPKDIVGSSKIPMSVLPTRVLMEVGLAMLEGALKYGRHNYRIAGVRGSVYYDAVMRHMNAWWEGEDTDPDSQLSHITKAISTLCVMRDSMLQGNFVDDRPPACEPFMSDLNERAAALVERLSDPNVEHYTEVGRTHIGFDPAAGKDETVLFTSLPTIDLCPHCSHSGGLHFPSCVSLLADAGDAVCRWCKVPPGVMHAVGCPAIQDRAAATPPMNAPAKSEMEDPRNWLAGDWVERTTDGVSWTKGNLYRVGSGGMVTDDTGVICKPLNHNWRFHARPDVDGWLKWGGGECPVRKSVKLEVRYRSGVLVVDVADYWNWHHLGDAEDIVAYRPVVGGK